MMYILEAMSESMIQIFILWIILIELVRLIIILNHIPS